MKSHDIVVIGASAGGVEALQALVRTLPSDLEAPLFVVLHIPSWDRSHLPEILSRAGPLPATHATDGAAIETAHIYVAPPDWHLLVDLEHVHLWRGPRESRHRPSINTLFRSAAEVFRTRVIGIVLSGALDDGTSGLWWIKKNGGVVIVQSPEDAEYPDMPNSAIEHVAVDYTIPAAEIGGLVAALTTGTLNDETRSVLEDMQTHQPISVTCPECRGPIAEYRYGEKLREYRCLVGHSYSVRDILKAHREAEERALWTAEALLEEAAQLARKLAEGAPNETRQRIEMQGEQKLKEAAEVRRIIEKLAALSL